MKNKYVVEENTVKIKVRHKDLGDMWTIIDKEDFEKVSQYKTTWFIGYSKKKGNHVDGIKTKVQKNKVRKQIWLHGLIMNCPTNMVIDHKNGNTFDNRKSNLRIVTRLENATNLNSISNNKSGYTNIYIDYKKYRVQIRGKCFGSYRTLYEAIKVRDKHIKDVFPLRER